MKSETRPNGGSMWAGITLASTSLPEKELKRRENGTEYMVRMEKIES